MNRYKEILGEVITALLVLFFALFWIDFGQGSDLTWWKLISILGQI